MTHLSDFSRFARHYARLLLAERAPQSALFVRAAYLAFLGREPDAAGLQHYQHALEAHSVTRWYVLKELLLSPEALRLRRRPQPASGIAASRWPVWREYLRLSVAERRLPDDELFLRAVYRAFFKREPDQIGQRYYLTQLQRGTYTRRRILESLMQSPEFKQTFGLPQHPLDAVHQARMLLFQQYLPPAEQVVDLGGAAYGHAEGALLAMGYPYRPGQITIIDLPPADRIGGAENTEGSQDLSTADGVHVRYLYRSMTDLSSIDDASIDLVVSGESIEHISEADADEVCREALRVLRPGGFFCLDTPNAALTRLQSPDELIHPEHQKEYYVHELRAKLQHWGFEIAQELAICAMPRSRREGIFDYQELVSGPRIDPAVEDGYLFFIKARKPLVAGAEDPSGIPGARASRPHPA